MEEEEDVRVRDGRYEGYGRKERSLGKEEKPLNSWEGGNDIVQLCLAVL